MFLIFTILNKIIAYAECVTFPFNCPWYSNCRKIEEYKNSLRQSSFYTELLAQIKQCLQTIDKTVESILCYGLGNFNSNVTARYQFALLLLFQEYFNVDVQIYDPAFSEVEINFLVRFSLTVIKENEEGARNIVTRTLIFMPHCPTALINNFLWSNWNPRDLSKCIILANSFKSLAETQTGQSFQIRYYYLHTILPVTAELEIKNIFQYTDMFNDLALHVFNSKELEKFEPNFWMKSTRPVYDETEIECISRKLSKNLALSWRVCGWDIKFTNALRGERYGKTRSRWKFTLLKDCLRRFCTKSVMVYIYV